MNHLASSLPKGVRWSLVLLFMCFAGSAVLSFFKVFEVSSFLGLSVPRFWQGHVWTVLTYVLLPANVVDFIFNGMAFVVLGSRLERAWSTRELWCFCLIAALGAGCGKLVLAPHNPIMLLGISGIIFGLLAGWLKLFGSEKILLLGIWEMSVRQMVCLVFALSWALTFFQSRLSFGDSLVPLCGGLTSWLYLTLRWRKNSQMQSRTVLSERMGRLEL